MGREASLPRLDRSHHSVVISRESVNNVEAFNSKWGVILPDTFARPKGQGDDGGFSNFTVTPTGETIWIDFGNAQQGAISYQDGPYNLPFELSTNVPIGYFPLRILKSTSLCELNCKSTFNLELV
jgi:hypothetical protein